MADQRVLALIAACTAACLTVGASSVPSATLALRLVPRERITEHASVVDRVDWKLPAARLEAFRTQGMVINEEVRTSVVLDGEIMRIDERGAHLDVRATSTTYDVPRNQRTSSSWQTQTVVAPNNTQPGATRYALEESAMVDLPTTPVHVDSSWTTRLPVATTLGSGTCTFRHVVGALNDGVVQINIDGSGVITGKEYNLPRLLPGTISLHGTAWFGLDCGCIIQESYRIVNTLEKPGEGAQIGFVERMDADIDAQSRFP
ncbi:MAG: hypothetical protein JO219_08705 [Candidatus Eremiobacteraeota bacterium]|nr:hypothetical protein [Candidatus Eremiobacteraeota bacterium]MBV8365177.1 hypothetical protein [Candidatus Eremiobacteraeota bacterium]